MKAIGKGLLVVVITIILFGIFVGQARADTERELVNLLEGKTTIYQGTCHLNEAGLFRESEEKYTVHRCVVGADMNEKGEIYYVLIMDNQSKAVKLIRINKDTKPVTQEVIWRRGATV